VKVFFQSFVSYINNASTKIHTDSCIYAIETKKMWTCCEGSNARFDDMYPAASTRSSGPRASRF